MRKYYSISDEFTQQISENAISFTGDPIKIIAVNDLKSIAQALKQ